VDLIEKRNPRRRRRRRRRREAMAIARTGVYVDDYLECKAL
jgi:hypothetical protein